MRASRFSGLLVLAIFTLCVALSTPQAVQVSAEGEEAKMEREGGKCRAAGGLLPRSLDGTIGLTLLSLSLFFVDSSCFFFY